jgi:nucleotide-binding universal stress UspA family protein
MNIEPSQPAYGDSAAYGQVGRIIVGVDDSESGLAALREAVALATLNHMQLVAVRAWALGLPRHGGRRFKHLVHRHVILYFSGQQQRPAAAVFVRQALRQAVGQFPADLDLVIETPSGDPALALIEIARRPGDVLIVGRQRVLSARRLVHGSVSAYCERHALCPVAVVAEDGTVSGDTRLTRSTGESGESAA